MDNGLWKRIANEWRHFKKNHELFTLGIPGVVYILIFAYLPMIGIIMAFKNFHYDKGMFGSEWIGFKNFEFFFVSEYAIRITRNTVLYEIGYIFFTTVFALLFAVLLNEISRKAVKIYQTALFLPHFLSWVVVYYIVFTLLDINNGILNKLLEMVGLQTHDWYMEAGPWPYILNIVALWKRIGFSALVYYAGIIAINPEYYEAAKIDGATRFQIARKVTIPMIMPLIMILLILAIGGLISGDFGLHYFVPNGGLAGMTYPTTDIIDTYVYRALTKIGDVGMATAVGLFQSVVGLILVLSANLWVKKINPENSLW
ncbi:sugar ABC transporter permease [Paenibacillus sp. BC26]|uniref:ABC transporter permease n=1 Tax=Paenibacillus sp. BC26 TaxID=1881032 RepID=UPI002109CB06|nr:ABC transporter permease subunit [Paenibacillus sp. BC26]